MTRSAPTLDLPPLCQGDRLTRAEFMRRYEAMPEVRKAELIDGQVHMPSPARFRSHAEPHARVIIWLGQYLLSTPDVRIADNATVRLGLDDVVQPDALLRIDEASGGRSRLGRDDYIDRPPELIVEIAASGAAYDLHDKKTVCRRYGVPEYVVWQTFENHLDWFVLEEDAYRRLEPDAEGVLRSRTLPGLWLDAAALTEGRLADVLEAAGRGTGTDEHARFAEHLRRRRTDA